MTRRLILSLSVALPFTLSAAAQPPESSEPALPGFIDGVTYAGAPGELFAPVREVARMLGMGLGLDPATARVSLAGRRLPERDIRHLLDGTTLLRVRAYTAAGANVRWSAEHGAAQVAYRQRTVLVRNGAKRVAVNRARQRLRAWQGDRLVLETRVSTGRRGHETPLGAYTAGPYKARRHYSSLYENSPMPWSVQLRGNIFIHGFTSVPPRAASHGCVRMPLSGGNPARWLFHWIDVGTPVVISNSWPNEPAEDTRQSPGRGLTPATAEP